MPTKPTKLAAERVARRSRCAPSQRAHGDGLDHLGLFGFALALVLAVAEHAEVAAHAAVGLNGDAGQDLLSLFQPEALDVEVRHPDPVRAMGWILAIVRRERLRETLEVLGDLAAVRHRCLQRSAAGRSRRVVYVRKRTRSMAVVPLFA